MVGTAIAVATAPTSEGVVIVVVLVAIAADVADVAWFVVEIRGTFGGVGVLGSVVRDNAPSSSATSSSKGEPSTLHFHS